MIWFKRIEIRSINTTTRSTKRKWLSEWPSSPGLSSLVTLVLSEVGLEYLRLCCKKRNVSKIDEDLVITCWRASICYITERTGAPTEIRGWFVNTRLSKNLGWFVDRWHTIIRVKSTFFPVSKNWNFKFRLYNFDKAFWQSNYVIRKPKISN